MHFPGFLVFAGLLPLSFATNFINPPTDLTTTTGYRDIKVRYKEVPSEICETTPGVKSFSGYVDVSPTDHIFFWFFEAREVDPAEAPLTLWLQGGPGSSSMDGLFQEMGPCGVYPNVSLYYNPYSWNNRSNLLFVDQPVTTGFSYTTTVNGTVNEDSGLVEPLQNDTCPTGAEFCGTFSSPSLSGVPNSTENAAPTVWKTLQSFMTAFPKYARNGFHLGTESYGGHYGPVFSEYFEEKNANLPKDAREIDLKSLMIGNGWFNPLIQTIAFYNFTVNNTYDYPGNTSAIPLLLHQLYGPQQCVDLTRECLQTNNNTACIQGNDLCNLVGGTYVGRDQLDVREPASANFPYTEYIEYLNQPDVLKGLGATTNFTEQSNNVNVTFNSTADDGRTEGSVGDMRKLIEKGVYVVSYAGDADVSCNWIGNEAVAKSIDPNGQNKAGYANISTSDGIVHGQVKQAGNFAFSRIYYSGHEVPFYQPLLAQTIFNRVLDGRDVQTGLHKIGSLYLTNGTSQSLFREGNSTVQERAPPQGALYNTTSGEPSKD